MFSVSPCAFCCVNRSFFIWGRGRPSAPPLSFGLVSLSLFFCCPLLLPFGVCAYKKTPLFLPQPPPQHFPTRHAHARGGGKRTTCFPPSFLPFLPCCGIWFARKTQALRSPKTATATVPVMCERASEARGVVLKGGRTGHSARSAPPSFPRPSCLGVGVHNKNCSDGISS